MPTTFRLVFPFGSTTVRSVGAVIDRMLTGHAMSARCFQLDGEAISLPDAITRQERLGKKYFHLVGKSGLDFQYMSIVNHRLDSSWLRPMMTATTMRG